MGIFALLLSGLLFAGSPINFILDQITTSTIQEKLDSAEQLEIRIDNAPAHQVLEGKLQKIRLASRGVYLTPEIRVDTLEIETDPVNLDLEYLKNKKIKDFQDLLQSPFQTGVHLVITETDLNYALKSEKMQTRLMEAANRVLSKRFPNRRYDFQDSNIAFLPNNRLRFELKVKQFENNNNDNPKEVEFILESGIESVSGNKFRFIEPTGSINGRKLSASFLNRLAQGLSDRLDLQSLEKKGIYLRVLQWNINEDNLNLAAFVRLEDQKKIEEQNPN